MPLSKLNLFIVDSDILSVKLLRSYLTLRFNEDVQVASFYNSASALKKISLNTNLVVLENHLFLTKEREFIALIKKINSKAKVIQRTSNDAVGLAIERINSNESKLENRTVRKWIKFFN